MGYKHMRELVCFAGGVLFGTAGIKVLASKGAGKQRCWQAKMLKRYM